MANEEKPMRYRKSCSMKGWMIFCGLTVLLTAVTLVLSIGLGCGDVAKEKRADPKTYSAPKTWSVVKTWSGNTDTETETFNVESSEWRIKAHIVDTGRGWESELAVYAYNDQGRMAGEVEVVGKGNGTEAEGISYVHSPPGKYYLKVLSLRNSWVITVEDQR